jgi:hypothetical protein
MAATNSEKPPPLVERLFPFARRARLCICGREAIRRAASRVEFVLITTDLSDNSFREVHKMLAGLPIIQHYHSRDLEHLLGLHHTKVVGFRRSDLASAIHRELRAAAAAPETEAPEAVPDAETPPTPGIEAAGTAADKTP